MVVCFCQNVCVCDGERDLGMFAMYALQLHNADGQGQPEAEYEFTKQVIGIATSCCQNRYSGVRSLQNIRCSTLDNYDSSLGERTD